ncbi:hypothetical protein FACS189487_02650 [Campylobacterota bacterium]|nr:hypothetical protein FACS189487_02650 [Campylobacterota bacterium]
MRAEYIRHCVVRAISITAFCVAFCVVIAAFGGCGAGAGGGSSEGTTPPPPPVVELPDFDDKDLREVWDAHFTDHSVATSWKIATFPSAQYLTNWQAATASTTPPVPYTGHLLLGSKYDPNDPEKDEAVKTDPETKKIKKAVDDYFKGVVDALKKYENAKNTAAANAAIKTFDLWLTKWAEADAVLSTNYSANGMALRKQLLSSVAGALVRANALTEGKYQPSEAILAWVRKLGVRVVEDYKSRYEKDIKTYNNHDFWAAWAVAQAGVVLDDSEMLFFGKLTLDRALEKADTNASDTYWAVEAGRGKLGAEYSNYALVPVMFLADLLDKNGFALTFEANATLQALGEFAAASESILPAPQDTVEAYKYSWLYPYAKMFPAVKITNDKLSALTASSSGQLPSYSQMGGSMYYFYKP